MIKSTGIVITGRVNGIKTLVIGGSGFIGNTLMKYFSALGTSSSLKEGFIRLDVRDKNNAKHLIEQINPGLVINSSGLTGVDYCESHPEEAMLINGTAVADIAEIAETNGSIFCHISTDYVFSGSSGHYKEEDHTGPVNVYGLSKLKGEALLEGSKAIILRISTPYGVNYSERKKTFLEFVVNNLNEGKRISIVKDQLTTPTYVKEIPLVIEKIYNSGLYGTFHLGGKECLSRYDFSLLVADEFSLDKELIDPVITKNLGFIAERPLNVCMDSSKISGLLKVSDIRTNLKEIRNALHI